MTEDDAGTPFADRSAGEAASEAFGILGNETRLAILLALWEEFEPFAERDAVSFSALRDRVGTTDSSQFNYHLDKLVGRFVESTDEGYRLTQPGLSFVRSVIAGAGLDAPTIEPTDVDATCTMCGGGVQVAYDDSRVRILCTECDGLWADFGDEPEGQLAKFSLHPAGLVDRTPNEIYAAAWVNTFTRLHGMLEGVCPTCSGRVERTLDVCEDHSADGVCPNCDRTSRVGARARCTVCKDNGRMTPGVVAKYHPAVVGFFHDHGLALQSESNDIEHLQRRLAFGESETEVLDDDPSLIRVTHEIDGDRIAVEIDENLDVVAVDDSD